MLYKFREQLKQTEQAKQILFFDDTEDKGKHYSSSSRVTRAF